MEREALITAMKSSISEVLEKMFFLPLDFSETRDEKEFLGFVADDIIISRLNFSGSFSGYFQFYVPRRLADSLTANFMGVGEESITQDHVTETVKEIINIITGNTFSILDDQAVFGLDIPELINFDGVNGDNQESVEEVFIAINTMEGHMALKLVIH